MNASLNTAKTEASTKDDELKSSQTALVAYKAGEDDRFKERATALIKSDEFNKPIVRSILAALTVGAEGAIEQLRKKGFLSGDPPPNFLDKRKLVAKRPKNLFPQLSIEFPRLSIE